MSWLFGKHYISSLHNANEPQEGRNSCPLLRSCFIGSCHVGVSKHFHVVYQPCSLLSLHIFLADQISCRSYIGSICHMQSLTISHSFKKPHPTSLENAAIPRFEIKITEIAQEKFQYCKPHVPLLSLAKEFKIPRRLCFEDYKTSDKNITLPSRLRHPRNFLRSSE